MTLSLAFFFIVSAAVIRTSYSYCDYVRCGSKLVRSTDVNEVCRSTREALNCVDTTLKINADCSFVKDFIVSMVASANQTVESYCSAMLRLPYGTCAHSRCLSKLVYSYKLNEGCRGAREALTCINITSKNNPGCSLVGNDIDTAVVKANKLIGSICGDTEECDFQNCLNMFTTSRDLNEQCITAGDAIGCFENKLKNNRACFPSRHYIYPHLDNLRAVVRDDCGGAVTEITYSTCDYTRCKNELVGSNDRYEMCRSVRQALYCLDSTTRNNPNCLVVKNNIDMHRANATRFIGSYCSGAAALTSSQVFSLGLSVMTYLLTPLK